MVATGHLTADSHVRTRPKSGMKYRSSRLLNEALINRVQTPELRTGHKRLLSA